MLAAASSAVPRARRGFQLGPPAYFLKALRMDGAVQ
jgi:hypothetical protein